MTLHPQNATAENQVITLARECQVPKMNATTVFIYIGLIHLGSSNKLVSENPEMADISHQPQAEVLQGMNCYEWPMSASDTRFDEMHTVIILLLIPSCSGNSIP